MGDSGEGLVDAEARIQEQIEEREAERRRRPGGGPNIETEKVSEGETLRGAQTNTERPGSSELAAANGFARTGDPPGTPHYALNSRSPMTSATRSRSVYSSAAVISSISDTSAAVNGGRSYTSGRNIGIIEATRLPKKKTV